MIREELVIFCLLFEGGMIDSSVYTLWIEGGFLTHGKKLWKKEVNVDSYWIRSDIRRVMSGFSP